MSISERRKNLINQINNINNEDTLVMLEASLAFYNHADGKDVTDGLSKYELSELSSLVSEPSEKDTLSESEFKQLFTRWNTK